MREFVYFVGRFCFPGERNFQEERVVSMNLNKKIASIDHIYEDTLDAVAIYKKSIINETLEAVRERINERITKIKAELSKSETGAEAHYWQELIFRLSELEVIVIPILEKIKSEQKS